MRKPAALVLLDGIGRLTERGLTVSQALRTAGCQTGELGREAKAIAEDIERGHSMAESFGRRYCRAELGAAAGALLAAGEMSGRPAEALALLREDLQRRVTDRARAVALLSYPALLLTMAVLVSLLIATVVLPAISSMYQALSIPSPPALAQLELLCRLFSVGLPALAALAALSAVGIRDRSRRLLARLPLVGKVLVLRAKARAFATAALLLGAGVAAEKAIGLAGRCSGDPLVERGLARVRRRLARGHDLARSIGGSGLLDAARDRSLLALATAAGPSDRGMAELAGLCRTEAEQRLAGLVAWAEPALVLLISGAVATVALLLYRPLLGSASMLAATPW